MPEPDFGVRPCCVPGCDTKLPSTRELPVCDKCGVKIAVAFRYDASRLDAVEQEARRQRAEAKERRKAAYAEQSQVYYIRAGEHIKIGFSTNMKARLSQLRLDPSAVLATEPGGRELEKQRHHELRGYRVNTKREDFAPWAGLMAHIEAVRAEHGPPRITRYISVPA